MKLAARPDEVPGTSLTNSNIETRRDRPKFAGRVDHPFIFFPLRFFPFFLLLHVVQNQQKKCHFSGISIEEKKPKFFSSNFRTSPR